MSFQYQNLYIFFLKTVCKNECFPHGWKKANIVPACQKGDKQLITNYQPVSKLPICAKVCGKTIFNSLFEYLDTNKLLKKNQSGFRPGNSSVHKLLPITYEISKPFDANPSIEV